MWVRSEDLSIIDRFWGLKVSLSQSPGSGGDELWNADEIVGDEIEHEVSADGGDAAVLGLAHGSVLLAPAEDALDHGAA